MAGRRPKMGLTLLLLLAAAPLGCKSTGPKPVQVEDISPARVDRKQQAIEEFEAGRNDAEFHAALNHWGQGELAECEQALGRILARDGKHAAALLLLAELKLSMNDTAKAKEALGKFAETADQQGAVSAAVLALRYNQPRLAIELLQREQPGEGASAACLRTLGVAYYRCGDYAAAKASLEQSLALDNTSGLAYFLLGSTHSRLGEQARADAALEQAARIDARFQTARQAR